MGFLGCSAQEYPVVACLPFPSASLQSLFHRFGKVHFLCTHPECCWGTVSRVGEGTGPNKRTIRNISVSKASVIQHYNPSTPGRALWTVPCLIHTALRGKVCRHEWVCSELSKIIKWGNGSDGTFLVMSPVPSPSYYQRTRCPNIILWEQSKRTAVRNTKGSGELLHSGGKVRVRQVPCQLISVNGGNGQWLLMGTGLPLRGMKMF